MIEGIVGHTYAVDVWSPARHAAVALDALARTAPSGAVLSVAEIAKTYQHLNESDFVRIKLHEHLDTDEQCVWWLVEQGILRMYGRRKPYKIVQENGGYRLADDVRFEDLWYYPDKGDRRPLKRQQEEERVWPGGTDTFSPMRNSNVRTLGNPNPSKTEIAKSLGDLSDVRESMREFGWVPEFPAIIDERDVVLVGHRRLAVAKELGIDPVIKTVTLGRGSAADAERMKLALVSNIGFKPMTPNERKEIAAYLYGEREWTMGRIGEALRVTAMTISNDLAGFKAALKPKRAKGGRPKGSTKAVNPIVVEEVEKRLREMRDTGCIWNRDEVVRRIKARGVSVGRTTLDKARSAAEERLADELAQPADPNPGSPEEPEAVADPEPESEADAVEPEPEPEEQPEPEDPEPDLQPGCVHCDWVIRQRGQMATLRAV